MIVELPEPWTPAQATERIREIARGDYDLSYKVHALDQLSDRGLISGDLTHLLKFGFVYSAAEPSTRKGFWKYQMQCLTPNSHNREVRAVVIPHWKTKQIKIVTVMWADEAVVKGR
jgi:hypothetical protein